MSHIQNTVPKDQRHALIGAMVEDKVARGELDANQLTADMDAYLLHPADRTLFGLPAIKIVRARDDDAPAPTEQQVINRFHCVAGLFVTLLLVGFAVITLQSAHLPGMPVLLLFAGASGLVLTEWVLSRVMLSVADARRIEWAGAYRLHRAQTRLKRILFFSGLSILILAGISCTLSILGAQFIGGPSPQRIATNPAEYATAACWLVVIISGYTILLTATCSLLLPQKVARPGRVSAAAVSTAAAPQSSNPL